jgi:hypothetical protein
MERFGSFRLLSRDRAVFAFRNYPNVICSRFSGNPSMVGRREMVGIAMIHTNRGLVTLIASNLASQGKY